MRCSKNIKFSKHFLILSFVGCTVTVVSMSIQDESFPHDELFELDLSGSPNQRIQFPHRLRETQQQVELQKAAQQSEAEQFHQHNEKANYDFDRAINSVNTSTSSEAAHTNSSAVESLGEPQSTTATESKTNSSDPTGLVEAHDKQGLVPLERSRKSMSYQDIHTEYTKRRYKHVESKVGQYIANIRMEDEKRRRLVQFQRHRSLPDSLVRDVQLQRYGSVDCVGGDVDGCSCNDTVLQMHAEPANMDNSEVLLSTSSGSRSGDPSAVDYIDKHAHAMILDENERLQSYNDHLQLKLDEKMGENMRLKQNVDFMRVRLSTVEDQLKKQKQQQQQYQQLGRFTIGATTASYGDISGAFGAGRQSLQTLLYCPTKTTTATQTDDGTAAAVTDILLPPQPPPPPPPSPSPLSLGLPHEEFHSTPDASDNNNSFEFADIGCGGVKSVATIQPMALNFSHYTADESGGKRCSSDGGALRRRSNSNTQQHHNQQQQQQHAKNSNKPQHNSGSSHPSSGDSAIEVEVIELRSSPRRTRRKRHTSSSQIPAMAGSKFNDVPQRRQHVNYAPHGRCSQSRVESVQTSPSMRLYSSEEKTMESLDLTPLEVDNRIYCIKRRSRWWRFFRRCWQCSDRPKRHSIALEDSVLQRTYTDIPLLESSSIGT